jgi:hypothetical protein
VEGSRLRISRRALVAALAELVPGGLLRPGSAAAFGQQGAFHARRLTTSGSRELPGGRETGLSHWAWELIRRTSAPGRLHPESVAADNPKLLDEPFCVWAEERGIEPLLAAERRGLAAFFQLGGVMFVDDLDPVRGDFGSSAREELAKVLPEVPVTRLPKKHVLYKSYYLVDSPVGRVVGPPHLDAMVRGRQVQVLFSSHDLLGALARQGDTWALPMEGMTGSGGADQRQQALRLAVNIAMYVLCSDYKDDQVHAEELMRRRGRLHRTP